MPALCVAGSLLHLHFQTGETGFFADHLFISFISFAQLSCMKPRDILAWQSQLLEKRFGICVALAFQAEDLHGCLMEMPFASGYCSALCTKICQGRWTALLLSFFPCLRVEFSPAVKQSSFPDGGGLCWRLCSADGCCWYRFFCSRAAEGSCPAAGRQVMCMGTAGEGRLLLKGNKLNCCFPVDSSPKILSDIKQGMGCKSDHTCKLSTVVSLFLSNLFLSRGLQYQRTTMNEMKTGLKGVAATLRASKWSREWGQGTDPCLH